MPSNENRDQFYKAMAPPRLEALPSSTNASAIYQHWEFILNRYITSVDADESAKLCLLANSLSYQNYSLIHGCSVFNDALKKLNAAFIKPLNTIVARYKVITSKQSSSSTVDDFFNDLRVKCADCDFKSVSAEVYQAEYMRDAFISGLASPAIRTRLLENRTLSLEEALSQARALELAMRDSALYHDRVTAAVSDELSGLRDSAVGLGPTYSSSATTNFSGKGSNQSYHTTINEPVFSSRSRPSSAGSCYYCGREQHPRVNCPARLSTCRSCKSKGHWSGVCRKTLRSTASSFSHPDDLGDSSENCASSVHPVPIIASSSSGQRSLVSVSIEGHPVNNVLIDSGSGENFVSTALARRLHLRTSPCRSSVVLAQTTESVSINRAWTGSLELGGCIYNGITLLLMDNPCNEIILGTPFLERHSSVELIYGGSDSPLKICALTCMNVSPPRPFRNLSLDCSPVTTRSR